MKVLTINTRCNGGGAARIATSIHDYINSNTSDSSLFLYGRGECDDDKCIKIVNNMYVNISAGIFRVLGKQIKNSDFCEMKKYIDEADVVHIHNIHGYYLEYTEFLQYLISKNKKVVWTLHDTWIISGRCAVPNKCLKWKVGCGNCNHKKIYPASIIDNSQKELIAKREIIRKFKKENIVFVTPSKWLKDLLKTSYLGEYQIKAICNGVRKIKIELSVKEIREKIGLPIDKKIILFVAADLSDEMKGIKYINGLIESFREEKNVIFVSVGKKNKKMNYNNLLQLGYIKSQISLAELYKASDIFINPSLGETYSLTIAEALCQGTKAIAFDIGPTKELITNEYGRIISCFDEQMLYKEVLNIINEDKLEHNGWSTEFINSEDKMCEEYLKLFKTICR